MDPRVQAFIDFLKSQQFWDTIWKEQTLTNWANGTQGSQRLNQLYAEFQAGHTEYISNWIIAESGHNLDRPDWQKFKNYNVYGPEIVYLQQMIDSLNNEYNNLQNAPTTDPKYRQAVLANIQKTIQNLQKAKADAQAKDEAADKQQGINDESTDNPLENQ